MTDTPNLPVPVSAAPIPIPNETAIEPMVKSAVGHLIGIIGTTLVARGVVTQGQVDGIIPTLIETIVGTLMMGAGIIYGQFRAWLAHSHFANAWLQLYQNGLVALPAPPIAAPAPAPAPDPVPAAPAIEPQPEAEPHNEADPAPAPILD